MPDCAAIEPLVTPYIDGEIAAGDRDIVEQHMRACPPCRARVGREQAAHTIVAARRSALHAQCAPNALHARCAAAARAGARAHVLTPPTAWRTRIGPFALAASLVIVVGGAFLYPLTARSSRVMAAELALDHVKCSLLNAALRIRHSPALVEQSLAADFDWPAQLPGNPEQAGLELVGERTCLYGEGRVAHVMYRRGGRAVSIFMLPDDVRKEEIVHVLGHGAAIWSVGSRTFVLVAREPHEELQRMASFVKAGLR
jgi:anti-sigma factor RsiW